MKYLKLIVTAIITLTVLGGCAGDGNSSSSNNIKKELKMCAIYDDIGVTYPVTIQNMIDNGNGQIEFQDKGNNQIIITHLDLRGTKVIDVIAQKINMNNFPSCYAMTEIYIYKTNEYLPKQTWGAVIGKIYGMPEEKMFKLEDVKQ